MNLFRLWVEGWRWNGASDKAAYGWSFLLLFLPFLGLSILMGLNPSDRRFVDPSTIGLALLLIPVIGHRMRRLNDAGRSGWWGVLSFVPVVGVFFAIVLCFLKSDTPRVGTWLRGVGFAVTVIFAAALLLRLIAAPYTIPSASMKPALVPGDYVLSLRTTKVTRGDIVVFTHPTSGVDYIKRVIATEGETVQMRQGVPWIDGVPLPQSRVLDHMEVFTRENGVMPLCHTPVDRGGTCLKSQALEGADPSYPVLSFRTSPWDDTKIFTVPAGHFFAMGDNRDNSLDSRMPAPQGLGFVPVANVKARAVRIVFSFAQTGDGNFLRADRWFKRLQ